MEEGVKDDKWDVPKLQGPAADRTPEEEQSTHRCISKVVLNTEHFK